MRTESSRAPSTVPEVVAHRGYAARYPENTLGAVRAAIAAGAAYVEVDVLLSADAVPVLMHDATLDRVGGRPDDVAMLTWGELAGIDVSERSRLGEHGPRENVASLAQLVELLHECRDARAFVEIKRAALTRFGAERVVARVLEELGSVMERTIVISFSAEAVALARSRGARRIGWVLERYDDAARSEARVLAPEFLFCNYVKLPPAPSPLWAGPWEWVCYEVTDAALALDLAARGVRYVETMAVGELIGALAHAR